MALPTEAAAADDDRVVARITDERVTESSGLVQSTTDPTLAYTVNDSGNMPVIYVVELSSGDVVGTAGLTGVELVDAEALAIGADERLYVGDIGDNEGLRRHIDLYPVRQPGRGNAALSTRPYRLRYEDGPRDAEALVSDALDGSFYIATKGLFGGDLYRLGRLRTGEVTVARRVRDVAMPGLVTDADVLAERGGVVVRTYSDAYVYAVPGWDLMASVELPEQRQGETVAAVDGGPTIYVGTEGSPSPLSRVDVPDKAWRELDRRLQPREPEKRQRSPATDDPPAEAALQMLPVLPIAVGSMAALAVLGGALLLRRRRSG